MSYREKLTWGQFVPLALGCVYYLRSWRGSHTLLSLFGSILVLIILQIVYAILVGILSKPEKSDERDRLIEYKAYKVSYLALMTLAPLWLWMLAVAAPFSYKVSQLTSPWLIVAVWFGVEALRTGIQLVLHRTGLSTGVSA
jgi:hypothetical protein